VITWVAEPVVKSSGSRRAAARWGEALVVRGPAEVVGSFPGVDAVRPADVGRGVLGAVDDGGALVEMGAGGVDVTAGAVGLTAGAVVVCEEPAPPLEHALIAAARPTARAANRRRPFRPTPPRVSCRFARLAPTRGQPAVGKRRRTTPSRPPRGRPYPGWEG
jgi:hypothetical protein